MIQSKRRHGGCAEGARRYQRRARGSYFFGPFGVIYGCEMI